MSAPDDVLKLIESFERHRIAYLAPSYNEANVRREFIEPLFKALGWDVYNESRHAQQYKDVVHEDTLRMGGATKAPDYSFRIGGTRKFFLEAKRPSVVIKNDGPSAYQLRRYAWSAKLPLSILTNFAELSVYDTRNRPTLSESAAVGRVLYLSYRDFAERWDELAKHFSRTAVLQGAFDEYGTQRTRRGTAEVDVAFLSEVEKWRASLARELATGNPQLSEPELNFAVQRTIDRIIFLRICEDRGVEEYGRLLAQTNASAIYQRLTELFKQADDRYNSGLFYFSHEKGRSESPDPWTLHLHISDRAIKDILTVLYYPHSPYEFSVLPPDILGHVYEQFLGSTIHLSPGGKARVALKPEVKKAGGVYYTPTFVVDYIVRACLEPLLANMSAAQAARVRILDPACGSGSFLIAAYQYLLDWHRALYAKQPGKHGDRVFEGRGGELHLSTAERKRILLNSIFGVDIDTQAVEVTKLSLLLKVLEGETEETLAQQLRIFRQRALPDLGRNIKCGNTLISPDFYAHGQLHLAGTEDLNRLNAFAWAKEFPSVLGRGARGFDAVIGNPPYVLLQDAFRDDSQLDYFRVTYRVASYKLDTYHLFIERGLVLTRPGGRLAMITPANFLTNNHLTGLRKLLMRESAIDHIVVIDGGVFPRVSVDNAILVTVKSAKGTTSFRLLHAVQSKGHLIETSAARMTKSTVHSTEQLLFTGSSERSVRALWEHIDSQSVPLSTIADVNFGKQLRDRRKYTGDVICLDAIEDIGPPYRPCYTGSDVHRYVVKWGGLACLDQEVARSGGCWDPAKQNAKNKLLTRQIGRNPEFGIDTLGYQCLNTMFMVNIRPGVSCGPYELLGILNSSLLAALWLDRFYDKRRTFPKIKGRYLEQLPIPRAVVGTEGTAQGRRLADAVKQIVALRSQMDGLRTEQEITATRRRLSLLEEEIDHFVNEMYAITAEQRTVVSTIRRQVSTPGNM